VFILSKISKSFGATEALSDISFTIDKGESVALIGPSGSGKTTLLKCLNVQHQVSSGQLNINGIDTKATSPKQLKLLRSKIAYIPQDLGLVPSLRVFQNILLGKVGSRSTLGLAKDFFLPKSEEMDAIFELLKRVGIAEKLYEPTSSLSGGQQQRVAVARALYQNAEVILADEPVSAVDPARAENLVKLLRVLSKEVGITLIMSIHNLELAKSHFPRIIALKKGRVLADNKNWKPLIIGKRRWFLMITIIILGLCFYGAEIRKDKILPSKEGLSLLLDFISAGFQPALDYQSSNLPEDTPPYYQKLLSALLLTLKYAVCAISLSIPIGIIFGFLATHSWWNKLHSSPVKKLFLFPLRYTVKVIITAGRSIHEVIWAILFVAALGSSPIAVIVALAIPYGSTLAKVFSETLDEQDHKNQLILEAHGGGGMKCWFFSTLPSSLPDILSYSFYRFECAVRSAAILGFVGIPTIGYHIQTAMGDYHLNEIWTLLYLLLITVLCIEFLSKVIRNILSSPLTSKSIPKTLNVSTLKKAKKKPWGLYITLLCSSVIIILSWNLGENILSDVPLEKRMKNLNRFIEQDLTPRVVRDSGDWSLYIPWAKEAF